MFRGAPEVVQVATRCAVLAVALALEACGGGGGGGPAPAEPVEARFELDRASGTAPLRVSFTDLSAGPGHELELGLRRRHGRERAEPVHVYQRRGPLRRELTVRGPGSEHRLARAGLVEVQGPLTAWSTA
jgi:PKD repeat protein